MKVTEVEIWDTLGIEHAPFKLGSVTRVEGANGVGKSSLLRALDYVAKGGTDPSMIRSWRCTSEAHVGPIGTGVDPWQENAACSMCAGRGRIAAEKSVIRIDVDNGDVLLKVTRRKRGSTNYTTDVTVTQADGEPRPAPQAYINELLGSLIDPSVLLRIDTTTVPGKQKLAAELTQLVAISFTREEVGEAFSKRPGALAAAPMPMLALEPEVKTVTLDGLKRISAQVTDTRRRVGVTRDDAGGTVKRLQAALPDDAGKDYSEALACLQDHNLELEKQIADRRVEIEKERADVVVAAQAIFDQAKEVARLASDAALTEMEREAAPYRQQIAADIAKVQALQEGSVRAKTLREELERHRNVGHQASIEYDRWTEVLKNLESLRLDKLKDMPVQGLVVEDGEVTLDGIPWDKQNLQRRVFAVVQIATLRAGKLPILTIDDAEHLDEENRRALEEGLVEAGFQLLEARVSSGPLTISAVSP